MKLITFLLSTIAFSQVSFAHSEKINFSQLKITPTNKKVFITIGNDAVEMSRANFKGLAQPLSGNKGASVLSVDTAAIPYLSSMMHENFNRCGGFIAHDSEAEAMAFAKSSQLPSSSTADYTINRHDEVKRLLPEINEMNILNTIKKLSNFKNRYYQSETGVEAAKQIAQDWSDLGSSRNDFKVELFNHANWKQPSVIATLQGRSSEVVIIGGHLDSIAGFMPSMSRAPGADDNASGIATITEVMRVILSSGYTPEKTIKFMGYAAEEVGLKGSAEIAKKFKQDGVNVIGVVQFDMTNFNGADKDIYFMTDFTNAEQNKFMGALNDEYLKYQWGYDKCGYGCSDHASWHGNGFAASMPFEASFNRMNHKIHTADDTLAASNDNASHAAKFARLGLAYLIEIDL